MSKKNKSDKNGFVFSTDPNFRFEEEKAEMQETLQPKQQLLKIKIGTKHRAGKMVTLVHGFVGKDEDLQELGKKLKNYSGTGGSAKDGEIIIQGEQQDRVLQWLIKNGYEKSRKG